MDKIDVLILGAGIIGLALANAVRTAHPDLEVAVLEQHHTFGQETSDRNSEVIHAGMYYPTNSLKAKLCVAGNALLYDYCKSHKVSHQRLGKLIITRNAAEEAAVHEIYEQGLANGVPGLKFLTEKEVHALEPNITATGALFSTTTGIISAYEFMRSLEQEALEQEVLFAYHHKVTNIEKTAGGYAVYFTNDQGTGALECSYLFNALGLYADLVPEKLGMDIAQENYRIYPVKGEYFALPANKAKLVAHLIYPPPLKALTGLGTHLTKSLEGGVKLGPSAFYVESKNDYKVDPTHAEEFYAATKTFLPFITKEDLTPDMAGIRPKRQAPGAPWADFVIVNEAAKGLPNLINLIGIESPGLTSSLAIADYAVKLM